MAQEEKVVRMSLRKILEALALRIVCDLGPVEDWADDLVRSGSEDAGSLRVKSLKRVITHGQHLEAMCPKVPEDLEVEISETFAQHLGLVEETAPQ